MKRRIALVGNPNVGKSTIFNTLTGMHQHTGNWAGVTVSCTFGYFSVGDCGFSIVDLPGIYSFDVRSAEEALTRDFIRDEEYEFLLLVCDATCLERGLHLLQQATALIADRPDERLPQVILCVNLCDEAEKKGIRVEFRELEKALGIPVIPCCGRQKDGIRRLEEVLAGLSGAAADGGLATCNRWATGKGRAACNRWATGKGRAADKDRTKCGADSASCCCAVSIRGTDPTSCICSACPMSGVSGADLCASCALAPGNDTKKIAYQKIPNSFSPKDLAALTVTYTRADYRAHEERLDRILTGSVSGVLLMCLLLIAVFWLTIAGANYPSELLWEWFFRFETILADLAASAGLPQWFISMSVFGVYRVVAWIVSVMLPPMAIFFPLFTLLEDLGYLPRVAFNMDGAFHRCHACGKQCLTMAMGLGCNAAGVTGCRIIDSPRERLIAILTNSLVPCNGRFPLLLTMIGLFFMGGSLGAASRMADGAAVGPGPSEVGGLSAAFYNLLPSLLMALALTGFILLGILMTFTASWVLSRTLLKGIPSSFTLELPPYRRPQVGKVIVRSIFDRTLFVLGRAVAVAAPAGLIIWVLANVTVGESTLLLHISGFLDPLGRLMGLDGIILMAFLLGFPANEIVLPIILMAYLQNGVLVPMDDKASLFSLLASHGWTIRTVVCMSVFTLFHWPCSTTCLTIKKETGSLKWTAAAILLPTFIGTGLCILISGLWGLFM